MVLHLKLMRHPEFCDDEPSIAKSIWFIEVETVKALSKSTADSIDV